MPSIPSSISSRSSLRSLAEEADRLTHLASSQLDRQGTTEFTQSEYTAVLQAANEVLRISDSIGGKDACTTGASGDSERITNSQQLHFDKRESMTGFTNSLHRSLLTVISWCTRVILQDVKLGRPGNVDPVDDHALLLIAALQLARRANELQLPLHIPLYNQLAHATAAVTQHDALVEQTLEISSWMISGLNVAEVDANLFAPALVALLKALRFSQVVDLLVGMRYLHDIRYLSVELTSELLVCLRDIAQAHQLEETTTTTTVAWSEDVASMPITNAMTPDTVVLKRNISQLISLLEPSVNAFLQQQSDALKESLRLDIRDMLSGLEAPQVDDIIASFEKSIENDMDTVSDGSQGDSDLSEGIDQVDANVGTLSESLDCPGRRPLSELLNQRIFAPAVDVSVSSHDIDSDVSVGESSSGDYLYMREPHGSIHDFPDVTAQFVRLNSGRPVLLSALYESILVQNDFDEMEQDLLNSFIMDDSDEDDDDSDDEF
jgi:hypothetical protein